MKTCVYIKVAKQIKEQEMLGLKAFFHHKQKHFVDLGLTGSVPATNYSTTKHAFLKTFTD